MTTRKVTAIEEKVLARGPNWKRDMSEGEANQRYRHRYIRDTRDYRTSGIIIDHYRARPRRFTLQYGGIEETSHRSLPAAKRKYAEKRRRDEALKAIRQ